MHRRHCLLDGQSQDRTSVTPHTTLELIRRLRRLHWLDPGVLGGGDIAAAQGRTLPDIQRKTRIRRILQQVILLAVVAVQLIRGAMEVGVTPLEVEVIQMVGALDPVGIILRVEVIRTVALGQAAEVSLLVMKRGMISAHPLILQILPAGRHRRAKTIRVHLCHHRRRPKDPYQNPSTL